MVLKLISVSSCLIILMTHPAFATENIYVAYDIDGTPHYSSQAYDAGYTVFLKAPKTAHANRAQPSKSAYLTNRADMTSQIEQAAQQHGVDAALLAAVIDVESGFNPKATSPKGAMGAMQLIPSTAANYGVTDPYNLQQNLDGGARYLKDLLVSHNGNIPLALAAYNAGRLRVAQYNRRIPPYPETMLYVPRVLAKMESYQLEQAKAQRP